jgi:hypothetical protein
MQHFNDDRVSWEPAPVKPGDTVHISYRGLLKNSGAKEVYIHYGVDGWKNTGTIKMEQKGDGSFIANIPTKAAQALNFCFKDPLNNWDNNNGWNWKVDVI